MKTKLTVIFCSLITIAFAQSPGDLPRNAKPGKCYAKCLVGDAYDEYEIEVPVYIGDPNDKTVKRKKRTIVIQDGTTKWVKKKADPNCLSQDPDDCLVWTLEKIERIEEEVMVVKDTSTTSDYVIEVFTIKELNREGGFTEWYEVLCANEIDDYVISQIEYELKRLGFLDNSVDTKDDFGSELKEALKAYQQAYELPIGNLDLETLDELGIDY